MQYNTGQKLRNTERRADKVSEIRNTIQDNTNRTVQYNTVQYGTIA